MGARKDGLHPLAPDGLEKASISGGHHLLGAEFQMLA
jgi:hypothetical protein